YDINPDTKDGTPASNAAFASPSGLTLRVDGRADQLYAVTLNAGVYRASTNAFSGAWVQLNASPPRPTRWPSIRRLSTTFPSASATATTGIRAPTSRVPGSPSTAATPGRATWIPGRATLNAEARPSRRSRSRAPEPSS